MAVYCEQDSQVHKCVSYNSYIYENCQFISILKYINSIQMYCSIVVADNI